MPVPVHGVGMSAPHLVIDGIALRPMLIERGGFGLLEMRLVPYVTAILPPVRMPGLQVREIDLEAFRIVLLKTRLAGLGPHIGIHGLSQTHIIVPPHRIAERLIVKSGIYHEIHAASHAVHHQAVFTRKGFAESQAPHRRTGKILLTSLIFSCFLRFPKRHRTHRTPYAGIQVIEPDLLSLKGTVVPRAAISHPVIKVGLLHVLCGRITQDIYVDGLRGRIPDIESDGGAAPVASAGGRDGHRITVSLFHGRWQAEEDPVVQFAGERMVRIHGLGFPEHRHSRLAGAAIGRILPGNDVPRSLHRSRVKTGKEGL